MQLAFSPHAGPRATTIQSQIFPEVATGLRQDLRGKAEIAERDRAFLREGLPVKLKFNAFPYQRYGLIAGTLEYISPATKPAGPDKQPVYEGRVRLAQDYYSVGNARYPLRYGMTATAEIVVRERRLIDLGLDPFRQVAG